MKIKPVMRISKPDYPDKYQIELNRALKYYRPKSWVKQPLVGIALAVLMGAGLTGGVLGGCFPMVGDLAYGYHHLTEKEALTVIADELQKAGFVLTLGSNNPSFPFDGHIVNGENKIDLEYVSNNDVWSDKFSGFKSEPWGYSPQDLAEALQEAHPAAAVFHDPISETPEQKIRKQVQDFIEWLLSVAEG